MTSDELKTAYELFKQIQFDCKPETDKYYSHYNEQVQHDTKFFTRFMSWVKQSYPDVWEAWQAVEDIKNGV